VDRLGDDAVAGESGCSTTLESLAVTMDPDPEWAAEEIEDANGPCRVPMPLQLRKGRARPADGDDVLALAVALDAASQLSPRRLKSRMEVVVDGRSFAATADASGSWHPARGRSRRSGFTPARQALHTRLRPGTDCYA
jgi:hypothetical protein